VKSKILIVGDSCLDVYSYCSASRLAPDKPVPVLEVLSRTETPGMAHNVFCNVESLGVFCDIVTNLNWQEVIKNRYVHSSSNHMFMRVDTAPTIERIDLSKLSLDYYETIIVSDYDKGFLLYDDIEYICSSHPQVILDTKKVLDTWAMNAKFIKINNYEFDRSKKFIEQNMKSKIIQTMGGEGCFYNGKLYPVQKMDVIDVSGAGDSFMAALCVKYTQTSDIEQSIEFANQCASEVVKHRGTTII
jgi:D-glycero-beta-D-manno-heptose-7-phosphate kinase